MNKIILCSIVILGFVPVMAFQIINQTKHDLYLVMKSIQTGAYITQSNLGKYILVPSKAVIDIPIPVGMSLFDNAVAEAFFTNNQGHCYHGVTSGNDKVKKFKAAGLTIKMFSPGLNKTTTPQLWIKAGAPLWCNSAYYDVDSKAVGMPASKPR